MSGLIVQVAKGKAAECAAMLADEFRQSRTEARTALMDRDAEEFRMHAQHMQSLLMIEVMDSAGVKASVIQFLSEDEQRNPYQLSGIEQSALTVWIANAMKRRGDEPNLH